MKTKIFTLIIALIVLGVAYACLQALEKPATSPAPEIDPVETATDAAVFSGTVQEIDIGCYADGICRLNIDGQWVVFGQGWYRGPVGDFIGFEDVADIEGKRVEVRAARDENVPGQYTILGDASLYVKLL